MILPHIPHYTIFSCNLQFTNNKITFLPIFSHVPYQNSVISSFSKLSLNSCIAFDNFTLLSVFMNDDPGVYFMFLDMVKKIIMSN